MRIVCRCGKEMKIAQEGDLGFVFCPQQVEDIVALAKRIGKSITYDEALKVVLQGGCLDRAPRDDKAGFKDLPEHDFMADPGRVFLDTVDNDRVHIPD